MREVGAGHGHDRAMGYRYRARIEHRVRRGHDQWRWVGEYHHMAWQDLGIFDRGRWRRSREEAEREANVWLDGKEYAPAGEYV